MLHREGADALGHHAIGLHDVRAERLRRGIFRDNARAAMHFLDKNPLNLGEAKEALAAFVANADGAGELIDRIRDRIRKAPPRKARFDLNHAIDAVIVLARSAITKMASRSKSASRRGWFPFMGTVFNCNKSCGI
jgi:hypothetical protein